MVDARQLMAPALTCLDESDSVVLAARRMRALGVSSVPVAGAHNGFIGMVFERDIVEHCVAAAADPREMCVGALVQGSQPAVEVDRVADAAVLGLVLRQPLGMLPVVDGGVLVGVITLAGIAAHLIDDDGDDATVGHLWWPTREAVEPPVG
jgi:predicted transcriptional regulator